MKRLSCLATLSMALAALAPAPAALAFGDKPVKLVVPAPAGGTMDIFARIVSDQLSHEIKQPVIVENRPGAGGAIAVKHLLSQPADGNTLLITVTNILTEVPHVLDGGFDAMTDVKPVAQMARSVMLFIASPQFEADDARGAIDYVKAHPGSVSFASYSQGTASHYAGAILNQKASLDMQHVPFAGSAPALTQVMGNQIPLMFDGSVTSKPLIASGRVKLLGVAYRDRLPEYPEVPTMAELGYPEIDFSNWAGVFASGTTPPELMQKMHATFAKLNASPIMSERYASTGFEIVRAQRTQEQLAGDLRAEFERNAGIVKNFGIQLN
ncbi:tripartite tricarboxylate transporter substrate binding protein [Verticiella sediminum]|uniref:Tripartite tricarboxylate transporter substrate binding protein n=1 Tax=Verticiella sediminum TaxID=1247510 RepID=A0A556AYL9_9BURK|nr:tripartite tricarboxylate transporter substrate binding protein [Verticiella sediminum]TSH98039.1 tripartite tricarboxylate transporter substrate binding protein [Verticiella sediminum]